MCARPADRHARIELLRAAEAEFVEHGVDSARVEEITARAGRSKGAFYLHFQSKEDAFRELIENLLARLQDCIEDAPPQHVETASPDEVLRQWRMKDLEIFEFMWGNRRLARLLLQGGRSSHYTWLIDEFAERSRKQTEKSFREWVARGLLRADLDVEVAALCVAGAYDRIVRELLNAEEKPDLERLSRALQHIILGGIGGAPLRDVRPETP